MESAAPPLIGIVGSGVVHGPGDAPDVDERLRRVKEAGVFDYYDRTPLPGEIDALRDASQRHGLPVLAGGYFYTLGRDEPLLAWHLRVARELGSRVHNVQLLALDAGGRLVRNDDVARTYLWASELGDRLGVSVCLEVHVNMWSEDFKRVAEVAALVAAHGVPFRLTLDASHVVFKIDNPREQARFGLAEDLASGAVVLDPAMPGNLCQRWIDAGWVVHAHARPAVPGNPRNVLARHPDGRVGRGIQYPFQRPVPGQWHSEWHEARLGPWKQVMRQLLRHHARTPGSPLRTVSTEIIPFTDYGAGAGYSLFDDSVALARWLRQAWDEAVAAAAPPAG